MADIAVDEGAEEVANIASTEQPSKATPSSASFNWDEVDWSKFSPQEAHRMRHRMIEEKHRGHDAMHAEMILILFGSIAIAQIVLFLWRQKHRKSYQAVTLFGLWAIPCYVCLKMFFWRMFSIWLLFTIITSLVMYRATRKKISTNTPRLVYRWFLLIYQITYGLGIFGYVLLLLIFTGIGFVLPFQPDTIMEFGVTMVFYGIYFGVMGRDCAELCVDYMAASFTYTSSGQSLPKIELSHDMCAVCGQRIILPSVDSEMAERTYKLSCNHLYPLVVVICD